MGFKGSDVSEGSEDKEGEKGKETKETKDVDSLALKSNIDPDWIVPEIEIQEKPFQEAYNSLYHEGPIKLFSF
jgi:hypothetical protein